MNPYMSRVVASCTHKLSNMPEEDALDYYHIIIAVVLRVHNKTFSVQDYTHIESITRQRSFSRMQVKVIQCGIYTTPYAYLGQTNFAILMCNSSQ